MRIATLNIWNAATNRAARLTAAVEVLSGLGADVVCLQEAPVWVGPGATLADRLREQLGYEHVEVLAYPVQAGDREPPEGLAFLSKLRPRAVTSNWADGTDTANSWGARIVVDRSGRSIGITTVHLDWKRAASRQRHLAQIVRELIAARPGDLDLLCGDFNDDGRARTLRFLAGDAEIDGVRTRWRDLAAEWHAARGEAPPVTLDFAGNPRWRAKRIAAPSKRVDRIYLRDDGPEADPGATSRPRISDASLFGERPASNGVVASDHYGVYVDLTI